MAENAPCPKTPRHDADIIAVGRVEAGHQVNAAEPLGELKCNVAGSGVDHLARAGAADERVLAEATPHGDCARSGMYLVAVRSSTSIDKDRVARAAVHGCAGINLDQVVAPACKDLVRTSGYDRDIPRTRAEVIVASAREEPAGAAAAADRVIPRVTRQQLIRHCTSHESHRFRPGENNPLRAGAESEEGARRRRAVLDIEIARLRDGVERLIRLNGRQ